MLQRLGEGESPRAEYRKCRGARLTVEGRTRAVEMVRHHRLIELYLRQELGYSLDEVRAQAETSISPPTVGSGDDGNDFGRYRPVGVP